MPVETPEELTRKRSRGALTSEREEERRGELVSDLAKTPLRRQKKLQRGRKPLQGRQRASSGIGLG